MITARRRVVPVGPGASIASGGRHGGGASSGDRNVAVVDLPPDDIRVIQRVLIDRGLLHDGVGARRPARPSRSISDSKVLP